ncbi:hypothetical protein BU26DRAFT_338233 [Trematosphaeria pertusa]|uniref:Heterokaryon incompatibility domain-containing protein n=1 Tax=Trematosphaeria pertusa TaxID=390896 RepID=A0A6A6IDA3_9PLEO|nr:uncharacterized protein BU26DRAFT_338233 [Trematosphaeria pertusa]KAF2248565.1 hypothetical protein BU26DRAFT_338233 [Trematosphaeria pertusa]
MGAIYSRASTVVSWLGTDNNGEMDSAVTAMKSFQHVAGSVPGWLEDLYWMRDYPSLLEVDNNLDGIPNHTWRSLQTFFSSSYWGRVWILQEMALARSLWVMVGQHILDYEDVKSSIELIRHLSSGSRPGKSVLPYKLGYFLWWNEQIPTQVHITVEEFRNRAKGLEPLDDVDKLEAIFSTRDFQATNPVDKVFALQGLLGNFITPDYGKSPSEVFCELTSRWIETTGDLYHLRFAGTTLQLPETPGLSLPSWVPDWQGISFADSWQAFPALASNSNIGLDILCVTQPRVLDELRLRVNACICDTISEIEPIYDGESTNLARLYRNFMKMSTDIECLTKVPYLQAILRTILADSGSEHEDHISELEHLSVQSLLLAVVYFLDGLSSSPPIFETLQATVEELGIASENHITSLLQEIFPSTTTNDCWQSEKELCLRILGQGIFLRPHLWRCLREKQQLFYTSAGYIGSSLHGIRAGDIVCIIQGCPCPVLLRREGSHFLHLGTCFVLGLMDGEAALRVKQGSIKIEEVDIV